MVGPVIDPADVQLDEIELPDEKQAGLASPAPHPPLGEIVDPSDVVVPDAEPIEVDESEIELPKVESKLDVPFTVTDEELADIAKRRGVDSKKLSEYVSLTGAARVGSADAPDASRALTDKPVQRSLWRTGARLTGGLAPDLYKKLMVGSGDMRAAIDDIEELMNHKQGYGQRAVDIAGDLGTSVTGGRAIFKTVTGAAKLSGIPLKVAEYVGEALGAGSQAAVFAKEGEEEEDIVLTAALILGLRGLGAGITRSRTKAAKKAIEDLAGRSTPETVEAARNAREAAGEAETALEKAVFRNDQSLRKFVANTNPEEIKRISALLPEAPATELADDAAEVMAEVGETASADASRVYSAVRQARKDLRVALGAERDGVAGAIEREGEEFVRREYSRVRNAKYLMSELEKQGGDVAPEVVGAIRRAGMFLSDARHVYDAIDNRYGIQATPALDKMSNRFNGYTNAVGDALSKQRDVLEATKNVADSTTASGKKFTESMWDALNKGEFSSTEYTPEQVEVLTKWRDHLKYLADSTEDLHVQYPQLDLSPMRIARKLTGPEQSYVPHYLVDAPDYVMRMRRAMKELGTKTGEAVLERANQGDEQAREVLKGLEIWAGGDIMTPQAARDAYAKLQAVDRTGEALYTTAKSLFKRDEDIPQFLLEKDVNRLAQRWTQNMYRHSFLRDSMHEFGRLADAVAERSPSAAKYIRNHMMDLAGVRRRTLAGAISERGARFSVKMMQKSEEAAQAGNERAASWYKVMANHDELMRAATGNMYTYYLGMRPDAALRNLSQPLMMSMPHLAATNPVGASIRIGVAYGKAVKGLATDRTALLDAMRKAGQLPSEQAFEAQQALARGLEEGGGASKWVRENNEALQKWSMMMYRTADSFNRLVTKELASGLIRDATEAGAAIKQGAELSIAQKDALIAVRNLTPGYRSMIMDQLRQGDVSGAESAMQDFMLGHTQFNYNRVSMSEYGRAMGGLFSMFSKWPTSIAGEILGTVDARAIGKPLPAGEARLLYKYLGPLIASSWIQSNVWEPFQETETPAANTGRILAGRDLRKWTPGDTLRALGAGEMSKLPPGAEVVKGMGKILSEGDPSAAVGSLLELAVSGAPGGVLAKQVLLDWTPTLLGESPIPLKKTVEEAVRGGVVNPVRGALGFPEATGRSQ